MRWQIAFPDAGTLGLLQTNFLDRKEFREYPETDVIGNPAAFGRAATVRDMGIFVYRRCPAGRLRPGSRFGPLGLRLYANFPRMA